MTTTRTAAAAVAEMTTTTTAGTTTTTTTAAAVAAAVTTTMMAAAVETTMTTAVGEATTTTNPPGFVVLREVGEGRWELLGEFERKRGLPARAARSQAILNATKGKAKAGEVYAAVLRSEWRVALDLAAAAKRLALSPSLTNDGAVS